MDPMNGVKMRPIVLHLFSENVNSVDEPSVREFREILDRISLSYGSRLTYFAVDRGAVAFQFDDRKVMNDILSDIINTIGFKEDYGKKNIAAGCPKEMNCPPRASIRHRRRA
jgi:hypothetical protein